MWFWVHTVYTSFFSRHKLITHLRRQLLLPLQYRWIKFHTFSISLYQLLSLVQHDGICIFVCLSHSLSPLLLVTESYIGVIEWTNVVIMDHIPQYTYFTSMKPQRKRDRNHVISFLGIPIKEVIYFLHWKQNSKWKYTI